MFVTLRGSTSLREQLETLLRSTAFAYAEYGILYC